MCWQQQRQSLHNRRLKQVKFLSHSIDRWVHRWIPKKTKKKSDRASLCLYCSLFISTLHSFVEQGKGSHSSFSWTNEKKNVHRWQGSFGFSIKATLCLANSIFFRHSFSSSWLISISSALTTGHNEWEFDCCCFFSRSRSVWIASNSTSNSSN